MARPIQEWRLLAHAAPVMSTALLTAVSFRVHAQRAAECTTTPVFQLRPASVQRQRVIQRPEPILTGTMETMDIMVTTTAESTAVVEQLELAMGIRIQAM